MVRKSGVGGLEKVQHGFQMVWERPKIKDENEIPHFMIPHNEVRRVWEQEKGRMKGKVGISCGSKSLQNMKYEKGFSCFQWFRRVRWE